MDKAIIKSAGKIALEAIARAYRADRTNAYEVTEDCPFILSLNLPPYDGIFWRFEPDGRGYTLATLKAYDAKVQGVTVCDGASLAPDGFRGVAESAALHDPGYLEMAWIAAAWKNEPYEPGGNLRRSWWMRKSATWTEGDVRNLFDAIFGDSMRKLGSPNLVVRCYYSAVRCFGALFHRVAGKSVALMAVTISGLCLAGCGGCYSPPDIIDGPYDGPAVIQVDGGEGAGDILGDAARAVRGLRGGAE